MAGGDGGRYVRIGLLEDAIPFLRRTQAAIYEGVYAQAREFYGPTRANIDAPVRIAQRDGCMRECSGGGALRKPLSARSLAMPPSQEQKLN